MLDDYTVIFHVTERAKPVTEGVHTQTVGDGAQETDPVHLRRLLRAYRKRQFGRRTAEKADEVAPPHPIPHGAEQCAQATSSQFSSHVMPRPKRRCSWRAVPTANIGRPPQTCPEPLLGTSGDPQIPDAITAAATNGRSVPITVFLGFFKRRQKIRTLVEGFPRYLARWPVAFDAQEAKSFGR